MGKQSTLGKFWGKPAAAQETVKSDEEQTKVETNDVKVAADDKVATSSSDKRIETAESSTSNSKEPTAKPTKKSKH